MTFESFSPRVGERFEATLDATQSPLTFVILSRVELHPKAGENGRPFSIEFVGEPNGPELDQGLYFLRPPNGEAEPIYLVPIGVRRYEAVFN